MPTTTPSPSDRLTAMDARSDGHPINISVDVSYMKVVDDKTNGGPLINEVYSITSEDSVFSASDALRRMADTLDKAERLPHRLDPATPVEDNTEPLDPALNPALPGFDI
jgi:hypothetical protein